MILWFDLYLFFDYLDLIFCDHDGDVDIIITKLCYDSLSYFMIL